MHLSIINNINRFLSIILNILIALTLSVEAQLILILHIERFRPALVAVLREPRLELRLDGVLALERADLRLLVVVEPDQHPGDVADVHPHHLRDVADLVVAAVGADVVAVLCFVGEGCEERGALVELV